MAIADTSERQNDQGTKIEVALDSPYNLSFVVDAFGIRMFMSRVCNKCREPCPTSWGALIQPREQQEL